DLHVDFRLVAVELMGLGQRNLSRRIGDVFDDLLDGVQLELAGLGVEPCPERLALVTLACGRLERVLHGVDDDFRFDALLLGDRVDLLQQRIDCSHVSESCQLSVSSYQSVRTSSDRLETGNWLLATSSKFHHQLPALDPRQRNAVRLAPFLEEYRAPLDSGDPARKRRLAVDRLYRHNLGQPAGEPAVVRLMAKRPVEAW